MKIHTEVMHRYPNILCNFGVIGDRGANKLWWDMLDEAQRFNVINKHCHFVE